MTKPLHTRDVDKSQTTDLISEQDSNVITCDYKDGVCVCVCVDQKSPGFDLDSCDEMFRNWVID